MILKQKGLSIVECLLAIAFSSALIWQVFVIYKDVHETHQVQASLSELLHHAQWFQDVMGDHILTAGEMNCVPQDQKEALKKQTVQAYFYNQVPSDWSIHAATQTQVLILGTCQQQNPQDSALQWLQTAYYLEKNSTNNLYTLYQKQKGFNAMAMQDDIASLKWYVAYETNQQGASTAPQEVGLDNKNPVSAIAWSVAFSSPTTLAHIKKPLTRIFYGYMSLHNQVH
jgi:type II secretory pathway component PulJ